MPVVLNQTKIFNFLITYWYFLGSNFFRSQQHFLRIWKKDTDSKTQKAQTIHDLKDKKSHIYEKYLSSLFV